MIEMEIALYHVADNFEFRVAREGNFTRKHDIQYYSQAPNVDLHVVVL